MVDAVPIRLVPAPERARAEEHDAMAEVLSRAAADLANGDLAALVMVRVRTDGSFAYAWHGDVKVSQIVGFLEIVKFDVLSAERARPALPTEPEAPA